MTKRKNFICMMRPAEQTESNGCVSRDKESDKVHIWYRSRGSITDHIQGLSTRDARLLAKRINQFLDGGG